MLLPGRHGGHLGRYPRPAERAEHERAVQVGHPLVRDHGQVPVADRLDEPLDGLRGRAGYDDRVGVAALGVRQDLAADRGQLDGVNRAHQIGAERLHVHARSVRPPVRAGHQPIG